MVVQHLRSRRRELRCVPADVFSRDAGFRSYVTLRSGSGDLGAGDAVLLSAALARTLAVAAGDTVSILTTWGEDFSGAPRLTPVRVGGIYETGYQELDATLVYAPLALAPKILSPRASRTMIGVKVQDPFGDLAPVQRAVIAAARRRRSRPGLAGYRVCPAGELPPPRRRSSSSSWRSSWSSRQ